MHYSILRPLLSCALLGAALHVLAPTAAVQAQVPETIAYQGYLTDAAGAPLTETNATLFFRLYDAAEAGTMVWFEKQTGVAVNQGVFAVQLGRIEPLTPGLMAEPLFLSIALGGEEAEELTPRVPLTAVPYSARAAQLDPGALKAGTNVTIAPDADGALVIAAEGGGSGGDAWQLGGNAGTDPATDFLGTTDDAPLEVRVDKARVLRLEPATIDEGPNLIAGWSQNGVGEGVAGATIAGGGDPDGGGTARPNRVEADYGTIGGGKGNTAAGSGATVGGGDRNAATGSQATVSGGLLNAAAGLHTAVGGGIDNAAQARNSTVAGGSNNEASGLSSTVGGGLLNVASGVRATVPGGQGNHARGDFSFAAGFNARAAAEGSFVWSDNALPAADSLVTTAPHQFLIRATGGVGINTNAPTAPLTVAGLIESTAGGFKLPDGSVLDDASDLSGGTAWQLGGNAGTDPATDFLGTTDDTPLEVRVSGERVMRYELTTAGDGPNVVGGWSGNSVATGVVGATIAGGGNPDFFGNARPNQVTNNYGTVSGGIGNTAEGEHATVGGGRENAGRGQEATVGGGLLNTADGGVATVGGGYTNAASGLTATVGGGRNNTASGSNATVGGGANNTADGILATVGGGDDNTASGERATVGGGGFNTARGARSTVGGGSGNTADGAFATVGGGSGNVASGARATVPGGIVNHARGDFSFAAGYFARAATDGTFVWSDNSGSIADSLVSTGPHQFLVRAAGGVGLGTNAPATQLHVATARNGSDQDPAQHVALIENTSTGTSADVLALKTGRSVLPGTNVNFVTFFDGSENVVGQIQGNGSGGVAFASSSGDFAEYLPRLHAGESIQPGDVVGVVGGRVTKQTAGVEHVMVVSNRAIVEGNLPEDGTTAGHELVALLGQVPVRVRGPVDAGDIVVPSGREDGTAVAIAPATMRLADHAQVIGRAWEAAPGTGVHTVTVAVGLDRVGALIEQLQRQQAQIDALHRKLDAQTGRFEAQQAQIDVLRIRLDARPVARHNHARHDR